MSHKYIQFSSFFLSNETSARTDDRHTTFSSRVLSKCTRKVTVSTGKYAICNSEWLRDFQDHREYFGIQRSSLMLRIVRIQKTDFPIHEVFTEAHFPSKTRYRLLHHNSIWFISKISNSVTHKFSSLFSRKVAQVRLWVSCALQSSSAVSVHFASLTRMNRDRRTQSEHEVRLVRQVFQIW